MPTRRHFLAEAAALSIPLFVPAAVFAKPTWISVCSPRSECGSAGLGLFCIGPEP